MGMFLKENNDDNNNFGYIEIITYPDKHGWNRLECSCTQYSSTQLQYFNDVLSIYIIFCCYSLAIQFLTTTAVNYFATRFILSKRSSH